MSFQEKIERINQLARKAKIEGLSEAETLEQKKLREEYIKNFRKSMKKQLHSVKVVDETGKDVTPKKLKESKRKNNNMLH